MVHFPEPLADCLARALRQGQADLDAERLQTVARLQQRERAVQAKLDRVYDDYVESRIDDAFWARKSSEWNAELTTVKAELARISTTAPAYAATGERILELAKQAHFLYLNQDPTEQRRLLETFYRTARSIAEVFARLTLSRSPCWSVGGKLKIGGADETRTRDLWRDRPAF